MIKILVTGGRNYNNVDKVFNTLCHYFRSIPMGEMRLVVGGAQGADAHAQRWAETYEVIHIIYPAPWATLGRRAGLYRNAQMLALEKPDLVVAFPGGTGTAHMVRIAKQAGVTVHEVA